MQSRRHTPESEDHGIDLAPMLDFVLNLLIFFIITTSFVKEAGVSVVRPEADTGEYRESGNIMVAIREWISLSICAWSVRRSVIELATSSSLSTSDVPVSSRTTTDSDCRPSTEEATKLRIPLTCAAVSCASGRSVNATDAVFG